MEYNELIHGESVVNLTKDSLEVALLRKQLSQ